MGSLQESKRFSKIYKVLQNMQQTGIKKKIGVSFLCKIEDYQFGTDDKCVLKFPKF